MMSDVIQCLVWTTCVSVVRYDATFFCGQHISVVQYDAMSCVDSV